MLEERQVVLGRLAEPDTGVEDYVLLLHARRYSVPRSCGEEVAHLAHNVAVAGVALHSLRLAKHVHQDQRTARVGDERGHAGIAAQRGDVVDDAGSGLEGGFGGSGAVGVYRDDGGRPLGEHLPNNRHDPARLFLRRGRIRARTGGLAADVYYPGTLLQHGRSVGDGYLGIEEVTTVREGVGGYVEDTHKDGVGAESPVPDPDGVTRFKRGVAHQTGEDKEHAQLLFFLCCAPTPGGRWGEDECLRSAPCRRRTPRSGASGARRPRSRTRSAPWRVCPGECGS